MTALKIVKGVVFFMSKNGQLPTLKSSFMKEITTFSHIYLGVGTARF